MFETNGEGAKAVRFLTIWFDPDMVRVLPPTGMRGRQPQYGDAAIRTCLTLKPLFGMVLRQTTGVVERLLRLVGLDRTVPDFGTLSRRQWSDPDKLLDLLGFRKNHANENAQKNPNWEVH